MCTQRTYQRLFWLLTAHSHQELVYWACNILPGIASANGLPNDFPQMISNTYGTCV